MIFPFGGGLNGDPLEPYGVDNEFFEDGLEFVDVQSNVDRPEDIPKPSSQGSDDVE